MIILTAAYGIKNFYGITSRKVRKFLQIIVQLRLLSQAIHVKAKLSQWWMKVKVRDNVKNDSIYNIH